MGFWNSGLIGEITGGRRRYHKKQDRARNDAATAEANARQAAAAMQSELAKQKIEMLQKLDTEVLQEKSSIDKWRNDSLQQADYAKTNRETELASLEQQSSSSKNIRWSRS
jgi:hypothetical protein